MRNQIRRLLLLASAGLATVTFALDSDLDGISDQDEANLHLTDPYLADTDHDGFDDFSELSAGTDPLDPNSRFKLNSIGIGQLPSGDPSVELTFSSVLDRRYALFHTSDLAQEAWLPLLVDIEGTGGLLTLVDENPNIAGSGFYRLATFAGNSGFLTREVWNGVPGQDVADLTADPRFPDVPDLVETLTSFTAPADYGDNYGQRISGYIIPPVTADYSFRIASDESSELWLSPNADPAFKTQVAGVDGWTNVGEWDKYPTQQSAAIHLVAGEPCYIEVLHKEGVAGDHLTVEWETPGMSMRVISGAYSLHCHPLPPTAAGDAYTVTEDVVTTVAPYGVLRNDTDPDGDPLSAVLQSGTSHGTLVLAADGGFTYTPDPNYSGPDSFSYLASDGIYTSDEVAVVNLTVVDTPDATITARNDFYAPPPGDDCIISAPGVLINDIDPDGLGIQAELDADVQNGSLTLNADGSFSYTANEGFEGIDQFTYIAKNGPVASAPATVSLDMSVLEGQSQATVVMLAKDPNMTIEPDIGSALVYENRNGYENLGNWNQGTLQPDPPNDVYEGPVWTDVYTEAGIYDATVLVSAANNLGGTFELIVDGVGQGTFSLTPTGDWDAYVDQAAGTGIALSEGLHTFKVQPISFNGSYFANLINCELTLANRITMPAAEAILPGVGDPGEGGIRLEDYDPPNLGYWNSVDAVPRWNVTGIPAGNYDCYVLVSGATGTGGTYQILVNGVPMPEPPAVLNDTGSWHDNYGYQLAVADLALDGDYEFAVDPVTKNAGSFTNLRECLLVPAGEDPGAAEPPQETIDAANFVNGTYPLEGESTDEAWVNAMTRARAASFSHADTLGEKMWQTFPLLSDWFMQDNQVHEGLGWRTGFDSRGDLWNYLDAARDNTLEKQLLASVCAELGRTPDPSLDYPAGDPRWLHLYVDLCQQRRLQRLASLRARTDKLVYAIHMNMGTIYLATETQGCPDGSVLREIDLTPLDTGGAPVDSLLFDSDNGIVRDPEISFDGQRMLFAWRQENNGYATTGNLNAENGSHYKIWEMNLADRSLRQLTFDEDDPANTGTYGADFEPCYLPNDDIMFSSVRCVQEVTCGWGDCSNLYIMDKNGRYARRVGFDQTQTGFPHLLDDGRVVFTRRDYNDRGQTYGHALFVMNPDGTQQTEYYGNNTFEPTSMQHTRPIPGTGKTMTVAGGYHTTQGGKLLKLDITKGRQDYTGVEFHDWDYTQKTRGGDKYGREGDQFTYPYPFSEDEFLVSYEPFGGYISGTDGHVHEGVMRYKLYHMTWDGKREMLAADPTMSCVQAVPVMPREKPLQRMSLTNYTKDEGTMYVQDVYYGTGMEDGAGGPGIAPGDTIERIRVVEMYLKPVSIGASKWAPGSANVGPGLPYAGLGTHSVTPTGVGTASFDAKGILGEAVVESDGSAMFKVPAKKPIYLQLINQEGVAVQTMRSWATLMPNEFFACAGCHEENDSAPPNLPMTEAMMQGPKPLVPFADRVDDIDPGLPKIEPFSYAELVQPILNTRCVSCHSSTGSKPDYDLSATVQNDREDTGGSDSTMRAYFQSYLTFLDVAPRDAADIFGPGSPNEWVDYFTRLRTVAILPPYEEGSATSGMIHLLWGDPANLHPQITDHPTWQDLGMSLDEVKILCAWIDLNVPFIGSYNERSTWNTSQHELYDNKLQIRTDMEEIEQQNVTDFINAGQPQ